MQCGQGGAQSSGIMFKTGKNIDKIMGLEPKGELRKRLDKLLPA